MDSVYDKIAKSFSKTRYKQWSCVENFLKNIKANDTIIELGCGNGRNILNHKTQSFGIDSCMEFVNICRERGLNVVHGDILTYNYNDKKYDNVLCVAVINHLESYEDRMRLIEIIYNLLLPNGKAIITGWNVTEDKYKFTTGVNYVKFGSHYRYYYIFDIDELKKMCQQYFSKVEHAIECGNDILILEKNVVFT